MWRTWLLLSVAGGSGERVVEPNSLLQATLRASDSPVQRIGPKETLGIVHIGKTGGSSLDSWLKGNIGRRHLLGHGIHCDMSYMDAQAKKQGHPVRVLSFLREPGTRAASQVLFWNTFKWPLFQKWKNWTLTEIMNEEKAFRRYHNAWGDGFGGVCWMAGTCVNGWYIHTEPNGKNDTEQLRRKELNEKHPQEVLAMAKANLERTAWFGILEDVERSIMLLQWQLGNNYTGFTEHNVNRNPHAKEVTEEDLQRMRKLIPLDMELYHYAQELFERRWAASGLSMPTDTPDRSAGVTGGHGVPLFPQRVPAAELQIESWIDSAASAEPPFPPGRSLHHLCSPSPVQQVLEKARLQQPEMTC